MNYEILTDPYYSDIFYQKSKNIFNIRGILIDFDEVGGDFKNCTVHDSWIYGNQSISNDSTVINSMKNCKTK